ncbi:MAG: FixH family protein [Acetobacteraceae bacterium]
MTRNHPKIASGWCLFPWAVAAAMLLVVLVNVGMVVSAVHTFPGKAGRDGFDLSNHYNQVIDRVRDQAALGWSVRAEADRRGRPVLMLTADQDSPLIGALVHATARRPLGGAMETALLFENVGKGRYVADTALAVPGQWDLLLTVTANGKELVTTRRVVVP